jgi:hypothetical protein
MLVKRKLRCRVRGGQLATGDAALGEPGRERAARNPGTLGATATADPPRELALDLGAEFVRQRVRRLMKLVCEFCAPLAADFSPRRQSPPGITRSGEGGAPTAPKGVSGDLSSAGVSAQSSSPSSKSSTSITNDEPCIPLSG